MIDNKKNLDKFKIADRFETEEYIGSGSTGIVYKAKELSSDKIVAIKALKTDLSKNEKFISSLSNELKDIIGLDHKNIVRFYELIPHNNRYFLIMEYVEGISLEKLIGNKKSLSLEFSINLLSQIAEALDYSLKKNVFHKALKPHNILIGNDNKIKLTDFGFAKAVATAWLTLTGTSPTQVEYMSPEQAEGENIDQRTDIYSLGIIGYQLLTGEVPFKIEGTSILSVAMKHINSKPDSLILKNPDIPIWLEKIIIKCLEKDPNNRYQSGKELLQDLNQRDEVSKKIIRQMIDQNEDLISEDLDFDQEKLIDDDELSKVINEGFSYNPDFEIPEKSSTVIINDFENFIKNHSSARSNLHKTEIIAKPKLVEETSIKPPPPPVIDEDLTDNQNLSQIDQLEEDNPIISKDVNAKNSLNNLLIIFSAILIIIIVLLLLYILVKA